ncbi:MAG: hypothetical protein RIM99_12190 [Cyclobacteriaceae bacterium]
MTQATSLSVYLDKNLSCINGGKTIVIENIDMQTKEVSIIYEKFKLGLGKILIKFNLADDEYILIVGELSINESTAIIYGVCASGNDKLKLFTKKKIKLVGSIIESQICFHIENINSLSKQDEKAI